jgi:hypothetical protein
LATPRAQPKSTRLRSADSHDRDATAQARPQHIGQRTNLRRIFRGLYLGRRGRAVPLYRYWNPQIGDHFYTTNLRELERGLHGWRYEGVQCYVHTRRQSGTTPLYRYWNRGAGNHFYTTSFNELGGGKDGWHYEGIQCYVQSRDMPGTARLYRYWNSKSGDHFYTTNYRELERGNYGWRLEGVQCYVVSYPIAAASARETTPEAVP